MKKTSPLEANIENIHRLFEVETDPITLSTDKGEILHNVVSRLKSPKIAAYILCRGKNVIIEGIDCSTLSPIDLSLQNSAGQTALELSEIELLKSYTYTNIDDIVSIKLINDFIKLAQTGDFQKIADTMENYEATYNKEKNILLVKPRNTDIAKEPTEPKVKFMKGEKITDVCNNTMPHYPSFDEEWIRQSNANIRQDFINAYRENSFPLMQRVISAYKIKFKGSDTISELAYEAIDRNCLRMTYDLLRQGSASKYYVPKGRTETLKDKYNLRSAQIKQAQIKQAQIQANSQVKEALATSFKRPIDENKDLSNTPPTKITKSSHSRS